MNAIRSLVALLRRAQPLARIEFDAPVAKPAEQSLDVVTRAVKAGKKSSFGDHKAGRGDVAAARAIFASARDVTSVSSAIPKLSEFVERFPSDEVFQVFIAKSLERVQDGQVIDLWRGIDERFPRSREAYLRVLRWTIRLEGVTAGEALHAVRFREEPDDARAKLVYGLGFIELKAFDEAEKIFSDILAMESPPEQVLIDLGRNYLAQHQPVRAGEITTLIKERFGETRHVMRLRQQVAASLAVFEDLSDDTLKSGVAFSNSIIKRAFDAARRVPVRWRDHSGFVGPIVLINGSLGSGGAERQFINTALGMHRAAEQGEPIAGLDIAGPVYVVCRSLHSREGADFFEPTAREAGLRVFQYADFPEFGGRPKWSCARELIDLLDLLPPQMAEGVTRLADVLRYLEPDVVHIWQDGSVLATSLAALLSGAPNIILSARTLPPIDRFERNKPEYEATYRMLMSFPNVSLSANSRVAAARYEEWLDLARGCVSVIPNGLALAPAVSKPANLELLTGLNVPLGGFVIGSVMRLDDNKRPLLWLDVAAHVADRLPESRFIIVGDGPLAAAARRRAEQLNISPKVLFVGRSHDVSFWLKQFDLFLLLSRHEGLPNVLIEAQLAGVPVVSTPVGGAPETMDVGATGTLLPYDDDPSPSMVAETVLLWRVGSTEERYTRSAKIRDWSTRKFSNERMLKLTAEAYRIRRTESGSHEHVA